MIIDSIEIFRFSIPTEPFVIASGTMDYAQNTLIRISTNSGLHGLGECSAFPMIVGETQETCLVLAKDFARIWVGKDPLAIEERLLELDAYIAGNTTIKSAFDLALYDLAAKHAGLPLYQFLGGEKRALTTDITVGIARPEQMASSAVELVKSGAETIKIKLGRTPNEDIERVKAIRSAVGPKINLRLDANQGWNFEEAVAALKGIEPFEVEFCEQPMHTDLDEYLPQLRKETTVKIMADESCYTHKDALRLIRAGGCDSINIKFSKSGGIAEAIRIHDVAQRASIPCMMGGMLESRLAVTAAVHFVCASPGVQYFDLDSCLLGHLKDPIIGGIRYENYNIQIPDSPGLGVDIDEEFLSGCERWVITA